MKGIFRTSSLLFLLTATTALKAQVECPVLSGFYPQSEQQWPELAPQIRRLMPQCLENSEYFALLGAAELNSGNLAESIEALERALLLEPENGAAQIDYAQALYLGGQLFPALELNRAVLAREDLPANIRTVLEQRSQQWTGNTRSASLVAEVTAGYDTNLNGAPANSELVLTLSGESIILRLDPQFQPVEGGYGNFRLAGNLAQRGPFSRHDLVYSLRNRISKDTQSDIVQMDWRYGYTRSIAGLGWEFSGGSSHLLYGGSPLYSVYEARSRLKMQGKQCVPLTELAGQYQLYHGQSLVSGLESAVSAGLECASPSGNSRLGLEAGFIYNDAAKSARAGGDRQGWRAQLRWDQRVGPGSMSILGTYANLDDSRGYSALIADGATRSIRNLAVRIQYRQMLKPGVQLLGSLNHQQQASNLGPFENGGTAIELGFQYQIK